VRTQCFWNRLGAVVLLTSCSLTASLAWSQKDQPAAKFEVLGPEKTDGFETYVVTSDYQEKPCKLYVLLPDKCDKTKPHKVLFVLPAWAPSRDGMVEAKKLDLANKHNIICVGPDFASMPWYVDHPEEPRVRYDSYLPDVVVPFIDKTYPTLAKPEGRLLVGFSKSGLGAVSLLLRHPEVFSRAGSWDGILIMDNRPEFYGSNEHYLANYHMPTLLNKRAALLKEQPARLAITGYGIASFEKSTEDVHKLLGKLQIPHYFDNSVQRRHEWQSGWLGPLVDVLMTDDMTKAASTPRK
jgi:esterase/lipase superfamily enzyme